MAAARASARGSTAVLSDGVRTELLHAPHSVPWSSGGGVHRGRHGVGTGSHPTAVA